MNRKKSRSQKKKQRRKRSSDRRFDTFFMMGGIFAKRIPVNSVTTEMLKSQKTSFRKQLLSARMCSKVLRTRDPKAICRVSEVSVLKDFLNSSQNFAEFSSVGQKSKIEAEIAAAAKCPDKRTLTPKARHHLTAILRGIYSMDRYQAFHNQRLLSDHVLVALEEVYGANSRGSILRRYLRLSFWWWITRFWEGFYRPRLKAKSLRRTCAGIKAKPGQEIAHKLSLFLAVELWKLIRGQNIRMRDQRKLKHALSQRANVYHTCVHTNRTLHVQYDNEIAKALSQGQSRGERLSPGAKMRIKQVVPVLKDLKDHSDTMLDFCTKSRKLLSKLK